MHQINSILERLSDTQWHSLTALALKGELSPSELRQALQDLPLTLEWQGERLRWPQPVSLLNATAIYGALADGVAQQVPVIELYSAVDSTNTRARSDFMPGKLVLAEYQSQGRGRHGRQWLSPFGQNLYLSLCWRFPMAAAELGGLSLAIGIAIARALQPGLTAAPGLKWPNDLYLQQRKLGGILVELVTPGANSVDAVIGVGLNVSMTQADTIDQPWVALTEYLRHPLKRNQLLAQILNELLPMLEQQRFTDRDWLCSQWQPLDLAYGQPVRVLQGEQVIEGIGDGITADGFFRLQTGKGQQCFCSGEVSLRLA